ncbi:uncharacterized protein LAESUDRAFT_664173 [Laetiporus sulphureus 93-53]|uniref:Distal membrane-arm assembly complex protein 1-like domain-containing protein n=1 Tax=Laetiporus sulphureus 93-53 TaxID=1314785 RepID=A0A165BMK3_9APHY|nr:uncharacterized protein LAESUDRAFT_664173 [Laetiporus sulphureus 93-53]KZT01314.1 hypothetical protein LAESUDRAFT_664173 [Laetiporus sulphureus 93-53]
MSGTSTLATSFSAVAAKDKTDADPAARYQDCLACRVIGTAALGGVGVYALNQSRAHQPGSIVGKRIMAGLGVCFLIAGAMRWTK